jgi:hypothetical protein
MLDVITRRQPTVRAPIFGRVRCGPPINITASARWLAVNKRDLPPTTRINRPVKYRLTSWRLDPPSNATAPQVVATPVRWFGRLRVRPAAHSQAPADDISETCQARGCFDMPAFCCSLGKAGARHSLSPVNAESPHTVITEAISLNIGRCSNLLNPTSFFPKR